MHDPTNFEGTLLPQDLQRVVGGLPGVDDQGLAGCLGRADMDTKSLALPLKVVGLAVPLPSEVVQPSLTDRYHLGVLG